MKFSEEKKKEEVEKEEELFNFLINTGEKEDKDKLRLIGIYEDVIEESAASVVYSLMLLHESGHHQVPKEGTEGKEELTEEDLEDAWKPIKMIVSTQGGSAHEMFSVYDTMSVVRRDCDIETMGLGKVMSAGVLLLASGTKGKRKIGANCRVMIHPVAGGAMGDLQDIENDIQEIKWLQKQYIKCLAKETNLTEKKIRAIMKKKVNYYFSAEEAIKMGIADEIL
jgi:ATP-dependent Clp endopeptidase proteolytic subunit ClpP